MIRSLKHHIALSLKCWYTVTQYIHTSHSITNKGRRKKEQSCHKNCGQLTSNIRLYFFCTWNRYMAHWSFEEISFFRGWSTALCVCQHISISSSSSSLSLSVFVMIIFAILFWIFWFMTATNTGIIIMDAVGLYSCKNFLGRVIIFSLLAFWSSLRLCTAYSNEIFDMLLLLYTMRK